MASCARQKPESKAKGNETSVQTIFDGPFKVWARTNDVESSAEAAVTVPIFKHYSEVSPVIRLTLDRGV